MGLRYADGSARGLLHHHMEHSPIANPGIVASAIAGKGEAATIMPFRNVI
jgi:hypothetical protein